MAISVGSVEVDVIPNTQGIYQRLRAGLEPAATRAGQDAGNAAGRSFGPAMQAQVGGVGLRIGEQIGQQIASRISASLRDSIRDGITTGGRTARPAATRQGDETGGAFSRALKTRLEAAFRSLPRAEVRLSDTGFDADLARLRARMETLSNKRIGIDVDVATAVAEITDIEARLRRLGAEHPNVQVRADTAAALAQLAAVRAEIDAVDGKKVDVDTSASVTGFQLLVTAALAFGPALIPVLPVVAAGLGAVAAAATAAGAGIGGIALVAVPAFKQISTVLQAQKQAQEAATTASLKGGQAASQAASRALQMASAQQALATAERNGARQIAQAQQQVVQAKQAAAQAVQQAAQQNEQAARRVQDAERALADAQVAAKKAQDDLTAARVQAAQELEDLNNRLTDSQLSQRDAEIQLKEATAQRDAVLKNANSTELDKQKALLAYDQAVQRLKEQTTETQRLKQETDAANKAGVKGSQTYKSAQDRLAQAERNVADQQQAVRDAQAEAARVQVQTAQQVAQAQQRVSEATANVAVAQQNAADAVTSAQRQIQQASLSAAGSVDQAAIAQGKYEKALAQLTPSARGTYNAFVNLRTAFSAWSRSLQPAVMPIFTRALDGIRRALPGLTPFVLSAADAIGKLQDRASRGFKSPWWQTFKRDLQGAVGPAITGLGISFGNIFKGMVGIIDAFLPHMDGISSRLQRITQRFATWGQGLKGSPEFERFLSFASQKGPLLADALGKIFTAFLNIGQALSPISGPLLKLLGGIAEAIGIVADKAPWFIMLIYAIIVATRLWTLAQIAFNFVMTANPLVLIGLAILILVGLVIYAYNKFGWFRAGVQTVWDWLKTATSWLWNSVLKPFFSWLGDIFIWLWTYIVKPYIGFVIAYWKTVANVAMWLWQNVLSLVFHGIGDVIVWWWNNIVKRYFDIVKAAIGVLGDVFKWLYNNVVKPVWDWISTKIENVWKNNLRPGFDVLKSAVGKVGDAFGDAKDAIGKAWDKIKDLTKAPINFIIDTVWNRGLVDTVWKKITDWIPGLPKLGHIPLLAQGGTLPVQPGVFNRPTAIVGEGRSQYPEYVIPTDPRYRQRALTLHAAAGTQLLAGGGIIGDIFGGIKNIGSKVGGFFSSAASFLKDPGKALEGLMGKLLGPLQDIKDSTWGKVALALPKSILSGLKGLVSFGGGGGGDIGGSIPKGQRLAVISQALAAAGVPPPGTLPQWQAGLNTLISRESGWNPRAINRWDSNAKAGHPSQGLAQTIPSTFNAYVPAALRSRGILDPVANVAAAVRYIVARYGNISNVQQANANRPPAGYDSGGWMPPGLNLMYNGLGKPEAVLTPTQWKAIQGAAVRGTDGASLGDLAVTVYVGDREITDIARAEVHTAQGELIQVLNAN